MPETNSTMKISLTIIVLYFCFGIQQSVYAHELGEEDGYNPNSAFLECKRQNSERDCVTRFPVTYRQVIPDKYLSVVVASETEMCFDLSKLFSKQKKVSLDSLIGKTSTYTFKPDDMSHEEHRKLQKTIAIHIHRTETTKMCSDGKGFLVNVGPEFVQVWTDADERDRYPFFGRDIWVSYTRGDWKKPFQFWK